MARVSVIIPTYNSAWCVTRAVQSVLDQTYQDTEVIVVDDGSTDETYAVLSPYLDRIRYIYQENRERSAARNRGIAAANGQYIAFLDADDWWLPLKLERQVARLDANRKAGLVYTARRFVESNGKRELWVHPQGEDDPGSYVFAKLVLRNIVGSPSQVMVRSQVLCETGGFDESLRQSEDWDLWLRIAAKYPVAYVAEPLVCYQHHKNGNLVHLVARDAQNAWLSIINKLFTHEDIRERFGHLEAPARARILLRSASIDCALSRTSDGVEKLTQAAELDNTLFTYPLTELSNWIIHFTNIVEPGSQKLSASLVFIDRFWIMLPPTLRNNLGREQNSIKSELCAGRLFTAYEYRDWQTIPADAWYAVRFNPSWLKNYGFVSIWIKSIWWTILLKVISPQKGY